MSEFSTKEGGSVIQLASPEIDDLRRGITESLPEIEMITDTKLRDQVIDLHAIALSQTQFKKIEDIPPSGVPESPLMKRGSQADHYRAVATMAVGMAKGLEEVMGNIGIDYDLLTAGALVHDVGKAYEFAGWERWKQERARTGSPALRHPVYGAHLALELGMPEEIVHCIAAHPYMGEGQFVKASLETTIVQYADVAFWKILEAADLLESEMEITGVHKR
jgi:putative nucleotidyltransferase with HDIG domain